MTDRNLLRTDPGFWPHLTLIGDVREEPGEETERV
jgi:hypothetical protein